MASMADGALAVECPACPHPGRNLPEGWDKAPKETQYMFLLFSSSNRLKPTSLGGSTHSSWQSTQTSVSSSNAGGSVILKLDQGGHTLLNTSNTMNTSLRTSQRQRLVIRHLGTGHNAHVSSGHGLWLCFSCRQPSKCQVFKGLHHVWCSCLRVCTPLFHAKKWCWRLSMGRTVCIVPI